jgi:hypothetical protein
VSLIVLQSVDRRPPTLLKQLTLLQNIAVSLPRIPSSLHIVPGPTKHSLALVSAPPLSVYVLEPLSFFDSRSDGLTLRDHIHEVVSDEESYIKQFVRTPDGTGLAVVRETVVEACTVRGHGTVLQRAGRWTAADYVVVLDGGKSTWNEAACQNLNVTLQGGPLQLFRLPLAF